MNWQMCDWCDAPARGDAWHNDGRLHPSCGQVSHGFGWVPKAPHSVSPDQRIKASDAAFQAYLDGESITLAARDLTNAITDAVLQSLGLIGAGA